MKLFKIVRGVVLVFLVLTAFAFAGILMARPGRILPLSITYDCCCNDCLTCRRDKECSTGSTGECMGLAPYTECCADACGKPIED